MDGELDYDLLMSLKKIKAQKKNSKHQALNQQMPQKKKS